MTIPSGAPFLTQHVGNGVTTVFDYEFKITDASDLAVVIVDEAFLTLGTHYTVQGVGNNGGGTITLVTALGAGKVLEISDAVQPSQLIPFANQGAFYGYNHENAFDKLTRLVKRALHWAEDAIRLPENTSWLVSRYLPVPVGNLYFRWNNEATAIEYDGAPGVVLNPLTIGNVADMVADTDLELGDIVETTGYYTPGDGGEARYQIVAAATGTDDGGSFHDLANGLQAKALFPNGVRYLKQFGARVDGVTSDSDALDAALDSMTTGDTLRLPAGVIAQDRVWNIGNGSATNISTVTGIKIEGAGTRVKTGWANDIALDPDDGTILKWVGAAGYGPQVDFRGPIALEWDGVSLDGNNLVENSLITNHMWSSRVANLNIRRYTSTGMWMLAYNNATDPSLPINGAYGRLVSSGAGANVVENMAINSFGDGLAKNCLIVGGGDMYDPSISFNHDVNQTEFTNVSLLANGNSSSSALMLRFCDSLLFTKCFVFAPAVSSGTPAVALRVITANTFSAVQKSFPSQIVFNGGQVASEAYSADWLGGSGGAGLTFFGFAHGERATASPRVPVNVGCKGFTDRASYFGGNQLAIEDPSVTGGSTHLQKFYAPSVLYRNAAFIQVVNTAAPTGVYSYTMKADMLAIKSTTGGAIDTTYDRYIRVKYFGSVRNNTGAPQTMTIRIYVGAVECFDATVTLADAAPYRPVRVNFDLKSRLLSNNQTASGDITVGGTAGGVTQAVAISDHMVQTQSGLAIDATVSNVLALQVQLGAASANLELASNGFTVELL